MLETAAFRGWKAQDAIVGFHGIGRLGTLERLIDVACLAPSVGLSQPWRFAIVDDPARRRALLEDFRSCNADGLNSYGDNLAAQYAKLKLAGLEEAPCQMAIFATEIGHGLGRKTMPEMAEYSVVAAIHTMWLAARAGGIGMASLSNCLMNTTYWDNQND